MSCLVLPHSVHPTHPSPQQGPSSDDHTVAVMELPAREFQPASTAAAACAQCHQLVDLLGVAPGTWDLCEGRRQRQPGLRQRAHGGLLRWEEAGQLLPLSKMTAATVPLQAQYGEVMSTRRSKPALTTAAQRCSWVRMFSAHGGERGRGGSPTGYVPPFAMGVGSTGAHLPTLSGGLLGVFGGSGRETGGGGSPWMLQSVLLSFVLQEAKKFHCVCGGRGYGGWAEFIFQKLVSGWPSSSPCSQGRQASKDIRARVSSCPPPELPAGPVLMPRWSLQQLTLPTHMRMCTVFQPPTPSWGWVT